MRKIEYSYEMLFLTGFISSCIPSRHITVSWSERKFAVHFTSLREIQCFFHLVEKTFIVNKVKIISKISAVMIQSSKC